MKKQNFIEGINQNNIVNSTKKYKKLLNDLLNISYNDSCLFSNIDNLKYFDVYRKFGDKIFDNIYNNKSFFIPLHEIDIEHLIDNIQKAKDNKEIIEIYKKYNETIPNSIYSKLISKKNDNDINKIKFQAISTLKNKKQKSSFNWKKILNKAILMNDQSNLWPLHLGFVYLTIKLENKILQAPLFFKEINIQIKNSNVSIFSVSDIKLNEKLLYFLESNNYLFDIDFDFSKLSIKMLFEKLQDIWKFNLDFPQSLKGFVPNFQLEEIKNESIFIWPGISLGFFEPSGGHLRKTMIKILENNLLDDILDIEFDKNKYKNKIDNIITKKNFGFYKIVNSNFSQDKAIISALNQNTIIWGPPGTGKSQTIANILTNILMFKKTALVVSQKRAALEVLKNRMKSLDIFCLFILNDKNMDKNNFYEPIKKYINELENFDFEKREDFLKIIYDAEKDKIKLINEIMNENNIEENIILYYKFIEKNKFNKDVFENILNLDSNLKYDFKKMRANKKRKIKKLLCIKNNIKKNNNFIFRYPKNIRSSANIIKNCIWDYNLNLDFFIEKQNVINIKLLEKINNLKNLKIKDDFKKINDDKALKSIIMKNIIKDIKNFNSSMMSKYNKFAMDVRTSNIDPIQFIKTHIDIIKAIYPIIVTTPETDLQSWHYKEFDYALLDESSQMFLEKGLPILYLAKIKILAGDNQQMKPSRWFATKNNDENPFGNIESLLDYAIAKGTHSILLDKNYRSKYASLMTFNSQIFYNGELDVIDTNNSSLNYEKAIEVINTNGRWENSKNIEEIKIVIDQTLKNVNKYKKIILLCFNSYQQNELENEIINNFPEIEKYIYKRKVLIRNIENIQGDEADLLIISVSYDKNTKLSSTYIAKPGGKNALNVAISRAREKMIIVKSIFSEDISNSSTSEDIIIFKQWLNFLDLSDKEKKEYKYWKNKNINKRLLNNTTTEIKLNSLTIFLIKKIKNDLNFFIRNLEEDVDFIINYSVGTIKIPLAILNKKTKEFIYGIHIDTFQYFKNYNNYILDKDVEDFFKMKNYKIIRISPLNWDNKKYDLAKEIKKYLNRSI